MKKLIAGGVAIVALAAIVPLTSVDADAGHHGKGHHDGAYMKYDGHGMKGGRGHHRRGHGKRAKIRLAKALERMDANGDDAISQDEIDAFRADRLKQFDVDGDGSLSMDEYEALWMDRMRKRMVRRFQRNDADGDGKITAEEFAERTKHMVLMRDRNDDGLLSKDDLKHKRMGRRGRHHDGERRHHGGGAEKSE